MLEDDLTLAALRMALAQCAIQPGLVHHSDRGSQYASLAYTDLLKSHAIEISMSRKGNPWDNAACESFMKSLKYEEVLRNEYRDLGEARRSIVRFLEQVYNKNRLHSARLSAAGRVRASFAGAAAHKKGRMQYCAIAASRQQFRRKQRHTLQGNLASDRIPRRPGCNRHRRVCADASLPAGLPRYFIPRAIGMRF